MAFRRILSIAAASWMLGLSPVASAQLVGCNAATCPPNDDSTASCTIANVTAQAIGTTNFTSPISPAPLTWTIAFSAAQSQTNSSVETLQRNYYLGTPTSLDLAAVQDVQGCALIFKDSVQRQEFSPSDDGTCRDFLGASCLSDLMSQANETFSDVLGSDDLSFVCSKLAVELRDNAPSSCSLTDGGFWGAIAVQDITGPSVPNPVDVDPTCNPTSIQDRSLRLIESQQSTVVPSSASVNSFAWGITPIMSIFYTSASSSRTETPDIQLSCLKPVSQQAIVVEPLESAAVAFSSLGISSAAICALLSIAVLSA